MGNGPSGAAGALPAGTRVALVLGSSAGGTGRHVRALVDGLSAEGVQVTVCGPAETMDRFGLDCAADRSCAVIVPAGTHPLALARAVRAVRVAVADAALVHAHGLRAGLVAALAVGDRVPLATTWHNPVPTGPVAAPARWAARRVARASTLTWCVSADLVRSARALGAPEVMLLPAAAPPLPGSIRSVEQVRAEFDAGDRPLIVAVARLHGQKDHPTLVAAAEQWSTRVPVPIVLLAGEGPERARIADLVGRSGVDVRLLGHRDDVADLLAAADVAVLTSRWEGSPLAAQEIVRAGRPLVATDVGGVAALIGDGAVLVPPGDPAAVADAVSGLLDDPAAAAQLVGRTRRVAAGLPTPADVLTAVCSGYSTLLGTGSDGVSGTSPPVHL